MVVLQGHGRWQRKVSDFVRTGAEGGTTPVAASAVLKSPKKFFELWYDPAKWISPSGVDNPSAEFSLRQRDGDVYALAISERLEITCEALRDAALEKARSISTELVVLSEAPRTVNGAQALVAEIDLRLQGIPFRFFYLFWSGWRGSSQVIAWTPRNLADEYRQDITDLLDGVVIRAESLGN